MSHLGADLERERAGEAFFGEFRGESLAGLWERPLGSGLPSVIVIGC